MRLLTGCGAKRQSGRYGNSKMRKCRVCGSKVIRFLSLGKTPLANSFLKEEQINKLEEFYPLEVGFCNKCSLVQLIRIVKPEKMFKNYIYVSSTSKTLRAHFEELAKKIIKIIKNGSTIIEIGSNDGALLKNFDKKKYNTLGIEPSLNIATIANNKGIRTLNMFFNEATAKKIANNYGKADVVIGTNVFAHIPNLHNLLKALKLLLKQDGFAVFESPYLVDLVSNKEFDTIYHEHVYYLSIKPLIYLFKMHGMELFDVERTKIHGGSIRFYAGIKNKRRIRNRVKALLKFEKNNDFYNIKIYKRFAKDVVNLKSELIKILSRLKRERKKICGFGAPAKGNTLLNYMKIDKSILDYIVDNSPYKQNLFTPGTKIPIYSPSKLVSDKPDYLLILAWNFAEEIMQEQKEFHKKGGRFIIPIPKPVVI